MTSLIASSLTFYYFKLLKIFPRCYLWKNPMNNRTRHIVIEHFCAWMSCETSCRLKKLRWVQGDFHLFLAKISMIYWYYVYSCLINLINIALLSYLIEISPPLPKIVLWWKSSKPTRFVNFDLSTSCASFHAPALSLYTEKIMIMVINFPTTLVVFRRSNL